MQPPRPNEERKGAIYIATESFLWSWLPILATLSYLALPPVWSLFFTVCAASLFFAFVVTMQRGWGELLRRKAWLDLAVTTLSIMLLFLFYYIGLNYTTAGNAALILFLQILFAYLYFNLLQRESIAPIHLLGALSMSIGALMVLFPGRFVLNIGDGFVLLAAMIAPIANRFQQRARRNLSSTTILFVRNFASLPFLFVIAYLLEGGEITLPSLDDSIWLIFVFNGAVIFGLSKILWIEGIHRISITRASAIAALSPLSTMLLASMILGEFPTLLQWVGTIPILIGGIWITRPRQTHL